MANLTRIKNNQITDSTILANTKIVPGSIVGSLFNANLTMTSDVTITGNLTVQGSSTYLTVASTNTYVNDPLIVLNNAFTGTNTYDIGLLINRGDQTTTALIWKEANKQFELTYTSDTGTSYGAINNSGYANLKVGNLTVAGITTIADIGAGNLTLSGDLAVNGGDITTTAATATVFNANATTVSAFGAATTLGIGAGTGTLTLNNATVTTPGQIISTRAGSATTGNGQIFLNGSTSNRIDWAAAGTGAPTFTTRTDGTKVVLYPALSGSTVDYAIGVDSATMWSSVPENGNSFNFKWYGAETLVANLSGTGNFTTVGDVAVNGGDFTTTASTFNLVNTDATTVNLAGAATALNFGANTGTATLRNPTLVGTETTQNVYNTTATTVNAFGAATTLIVGAATGIANLRNATTNVIGNATVGGTLAVTGDTTLTADLAVNGGDLTTSASTFNLIDANATTVNFAGAATAIDLGATTGTLTINNPTVVGSQASQDLYNTTATTLNFAGAATTLIVGATSGIANLRNATTNILGNATVGGTLAVTGDATLTADLAVNGGDLTTTASTFNLLNANATTVDAFKAATDLEFGATSGTLTINNPTVVGSQSTQNLYNTTATTLNLAGAATTLIVGATTGIANIRNATTNIIGNATVGGTLAVTGDTTLTGDLAVNGGDITTTSATATVFNTNATTVDAFKAATDLEFGATSGTLTINNPTVVGTQATQDVFNTAATTVNAFGAATTLIVGATTGVANIRNATTNIIGNATVGGTLDVTGNAAVTGILNVTGAVTLTDDLAVNGGDLTTTASTFNLLNANATTVDAFKAATDLEFGATSGTLTINNPTVVGSQTTQNLYNTTATTLNIGGAATVLNLGASTGNTTVQNNLITTGNIKLDATTQSTNATSGALIVAGGVGIAKNLNVGGNIVVTGDLTVNGNVTTLNTATLDVEDLNITVAKGAADSAAADGAGLTVDGASATILYTHATTSWNLNKHLIGTSAQFGTTLGVTGDTTLTADLAVNGGDITTSASTFNLLNANATTVDAFKAATDLEFGATSGTLTINNPTVVGTQASQDLYNTTATTLNFAGAATTLIVGATTGIANIRNATTNIIGNATVGGTLAITGDTTLTGDLAVNGGDITTTSATATLFNINATTVDAFKAATDLEFGATTGTLTINNPTVVGTQASQDLYNTAATTLNFAGAATALTVGATSGTATIRNANVAFPNATTFFSSQSTVSLFNTNITTVDMFGGASDIEFGTTSGTFKINNPSLVGSQSTQDVFNTAATTVNAFGAATTLTVGATTGVANIRNATTNIIGNATVGGTLGVTGNATVTGILNVTGAVTLTDDLAVNGGDITTTASTFNLVNANATTVDAFKAATDLEFGATTGTLTINNPTVVGTQTTQAVFNTTATTVNAFGAATTMILGATTGTANIRNATTNILGNTSILAETDSTSTDTGVLIVAGGVGIAKTVHVGGNVYVNSGKRLAVGADLVSNVIYPENVAQITSTANNYSRISIQNISTGTHATSEFIAIADNGSNVANYMSMGIAGSGFNEGIIVKPGDGYTIVHEGNLVLSSTGNDIKFSVGGLTAPNILVKISNSDANVSILANADSDSTTTGALTVAGGVGIAKRLRVAGDTILTGDLAVNGGDLTTTAGTFNLIDDTATTLNFAGAATTIDLGATSGTLTINNPTVVGSQSTQDLYNTTATTMNFAGAATTLIVGASTGVANIRNATTNVIGNATVGGTLDVSAGATINSTQTSGNFVVKGAVATSLIVANSTYGAVVIGGSNATPQLGATLKINSSDSMLVPVGSTADRPSNSGNVDVTGMMRYSTTLNALEFYNGTAWIPAGSDSTFTIITSEQFTGDGVEDTYTLSANTTTNGTMVSINGVVQIPTFSYSITIDQLVFTEIPAVGDLIDVRILTTTQTTGSEISSGNGLNSFLATDADGAQLYSGTSAKTLRVTAAPDGSWAYKNGTKTTYDQTVTNIASAATPVIVDSFATASYTTAKYIVQTKNGSSVESMEAVLVQDGANAYVSIFGIVSSGSGLGTLSANIVSGNVKLYYTSTSVTNSNVKVYTTYIV